MESLVLSGFGCRPDLLQGQQYHSAEDRGQHHRPASPLQPDTPRQRYPCVPPGVRADSGLVGGGRGVGGEDGLVPLQGDQLSSG